MGILLTKVGIIGATGYTGLELLRCLLYHPKAEVTIATSRQFAGQKVAVLFPFLKGYQDLTLSPLDLETVAKQTEVVFTALPHQVAMEVVSFFIKKGKKVIDLSADFRLKDPGVYETWYGPHKAKELLPLAIYGLPEIYSEKIRGATLVANPGCYPTTAILALAPFLSEGVIELNNIIIDAKSGVSGAGRGAKLATHFCEVNENMEAYKVCNHRHTPEIEQELTQLAGKVVKVTFVPHLIPISRGMFTTVYARLIKAITSETAHCLMTDYYKNKPFIEVLPPENVPKTIYVRGTNICQLGVKVDKKSSTIVIMAAIDNLAKGASTQAIQNMNLMLHFPEEMGLKTLPVFP
ncbi:N-acetyl-gamma-glutamyl-phosphate reductase [Candidatus Methanoperedenaceae archaeon GB50]|nr:N-acetyl-gamma-glutamyl-phosphate reductase [Candidatus Methanoperedenaceae archaeon GB50]